jgi:hypothetical protein
MRHFLRGGVSEPSAISALASSVMPSPIEGGLVLLPRPPLSLEPLLVPA